MANDTKHRCAGITRAGTPCKTCIPSSRVFCDKHMPARTLADANAKILALVELGVLKQGERAMRGHDVRCPYMQDRSFQCTCDRMELTWPDYNEMRVEAAH